MDQPEPLPPETSLQTQPPAIEDNQKLIRKVTRIAAIGSLILGVIILLVGNNILLGAVLILIGVTDLILVPHILATIITAQLKNRNNKG